MKRGASPPPLPSLGGGTGGGVSSSSVVAAATSVGGSAQKKNNHKTTMMTTKKKSFYSTGAANKKNKPNATTKRHSREHYLREDIFCGIKQAPVEYKERRDEWIWMEEKEEEYEYKNTIETPRQETKKKDDTKSTIYVVDANVCLHQMDVLSPEV